VCCLWDSFYLIGGSDCMSFVGMFGVDLESECVLFVCQFEVDLGE